MVTLEAIIPLAGDTPDGFRLDAWFVDVDATVLFALFIGELSAAPGGTGLKAPESLRTGSTAG